MHGRGAVLYESGDLFEGTFARGVWHGRGLHFSRREGRAKRGVWRQGLLVTVALQISVRRNPGENQR